MFVVVGSLTVDVLIPGDLAGAGGGEDGFRADNLAFTAQPASISMGGNGGNTAYVLAGLGVRTALCSAVGTDLLGDTLVGWLDDRGVDLSGLGRDPDHSTSTSAIIMTDSANQVVFHHSGAYARYRFDDIPPRLLADATVLLVTSYPIMEGLRPDGIRRAVEIVRRAGGITAIDAGPAIGRPVTLEELAPLLPAVDYFIANDHEAASVAGLAGWEEAAAAILDGGAGHVVVKHGAAGADAIGSNGRRHVPAFRVDARMSVGAGDSFGAGVLGSLARGRSLEEALRYGAAVAAMVVVSPDGILAAPSHRDVEGFLAARG